MDTTLAARGVEMRALRSAGASNEAIYEMVAGAIATRHAGGGALVDVGCGHGRLWSYVEPQFDRYVGVDVIRYDDFPPRGEFHALDLDHASAPLADGIGDVVAGVETIEHVENPRAFVRELVRLCRPGGCVIVTTPNQLSLLSKLTLLATNEFNAFRASSYPAHLTALLEVDLRRIAAESGISDVAVRYSRAGRVPGTSRHFPGLFSRINPRLFSDNVLLVGRRR